MAHPVPLLLGLGLLLTFGTRPTKPARGGGGGEEKSEHLPTCDNALAYAAALVRRVYEANNADMEQAIDAFENGAELALSACPPSVFSCRSEACRRAIEQTTTDVQKIGKGSVRAGALFERLYKACPFLFDRNAMLVTLHLPSGTRDVRIAPVTKETIEPVLEELVAANLEYLKTHPRTPSLYASGVRYGIETFGLEEYNAIPFMLASKVGDCEDLSCARVAELRRAGVQAKPYVTSQVFTAGELTTKLFHVQVRYPDGKIEDPSERLGMGTVLGGGGR